MMSMKKRSNVRLVLSMSLLSPVSCTDFPHPERIRRGNDPARDLSLVFCPSLYLFRLIRRFQL
jgi:hypothetical protein